MSILVGGAKVRSAEEVSRKVMGGKEFVGLGGLQWLALSICRDLYLSICLPYTFLAVR